MSNRRQPRQTRVTEHSSQRAGLDVSPKEGAQRHDVGSRTAGIGEKFMPKTEDGPR
jgi:hypothetical protein